MAKPPKCRGSIDARRRALEKLADRTAERVKKRIAALDARFAARADRLRLAAAAAEDKVRGGRLAPAAKSRRFAAIRKQLRGRLVVLERARRDERRTVARSEECRALGRVRREQVLGSCGAACHLGLPSGIGGSESVVVLQSARGQLRAMPARFVLVSAGALVPSHDFQTFDLRPDYPDRTQERRYEVDASEKMKVVDIAQNMQPGLLANTNTGAVDGTPVVAAGTGVVLGGNGRTMGAQRHYASGRHVLADYLRAHAGQFGFRAEDVAQFSDPIVVRVVDAPQSAWPRLVRDLNVGLTQQMDAAVEAAAHSRHLPADTAQILAGAGLDRRDLSDFLRSPDSTPMVGALERSGFLNRANRQRWLGKDGLLTADARRQLEVQLAELLVGDAALLEQVGADTRGALVRGAPFLLAAGAQSRFDIQGALREALADLVDLRSSGMCLARWEQQTSLVARRTREGTTARVLLHVLSLSGNRPVVFAKISRGFLDRMNGGLFGGADPTTALEQSAKAAKVSPEQANSRRRCKR